MEFCHGGSLESLLRREPCADTQKISFVYGAAKGMAYVELMKVIHRLAIINSLHFLLQVEIFIYLESFYEWFHF